MNDVEREMRADWLTNRPEPELPELDPIDPGTTTRLVCPDCATTGLIRQFESLWCDNCGWSGEDRKDPQPSTDPFDVEEDNEEGNDEPPWDTWAEQRGER